MQEEQSARFNPQEEGDKTLFNLLTSGEVDSVERYLINTVPRLSLGKIISDLDLYVNDRQAIINRQYYNLPQQPARYSRKKVSTLPREDIPEDLREQREENAELRMRISATFFCEQGFNPRKAANQHPEITQSDFRSMVQSIVKNISEMLFKAIRIKFKQEIALSNHEKDLIHQQMKKAHSWMPKENPSAFSTLLKLIRQEYLRIRAIVEDAELGELYNTIVKRVNCNNIDLSALEERGKNFGPEIEAQFPAIQQEPVFKMDKKKVDIVAVQVGKNKVEVKRPREESNRLQRSEEDALEEEIVETAVVQNPEPLNYSQDVAYLLQDQ